MLSLCVLCHVADQYATNIKLGGGGEVTCMYQTYLFHLNIAAVITVYMNKINKADCQIEIWMKILVDWEFIRV